MEVISRSAITIKYKQPFIDWNNSVFPALPMEIDILGESKTYLIDEIDDPIKPVKKHFRKIFEFELFGICTDENMWPDKINFKLFNDWFDYEVSDWVMDLSNKPYDLDHY
jgi:hypothetical protein